MDRERTLDCGCAPNGSRVAVVAFDPALSNFSRASAFPVFAGNVARWCVDWFSPVSTPGNRITAEAPAATTSIVVTRAPSLTATADRAPDAADGAGRVSVKIGPRHIYDFGTRRLGGRRSGTAVANVTNGGVAPGPPPYWRRPRWMSIQAQTRPRHGGGYRRHCRDSSCRRMACRHVPWRSMSIAALTIRLPGAMLLLAAPMLMALLTWRRVANIAVLLRLAAMTALILAIAQPEWRAGAASGPPDRGRGPVGQHQRRRSQGRDRLDTAGRRARVRAVAREPGRFRRRRRRDKDFPAAHAAEIQRLLAYSPVDGAQTKLALCRAANRRRNGGARVQDRAVNRWPANDG